MIGGIVSIRTGQVPLTKIGQGIPGGTKVNHIALGEHNESIKGEKESRIGLMKGRNDRLALISGQLLQHVHQGHRTRRIESTG